MNEDADFLARIQRAMWAGDHNLLRELAPCDCCCDEHYSTDCPARAWNGCRGGHGDRPEDDPAWLAMAYEREGDP